MFKTILVATDESSHAKKAVAVASDLAATYGARLIVLHALLRDAPSATLRKLANRRALSKAQRELLDNYEVNAQMVVASSGYDGGAIVPMPPPHELLEAVGRQILDRAVAVAKRAKVKKVATLLSGGDPAESVLAAARRQKADLIVVGTRGYGEIKGLLLGSVSHKINQRATKPVLTVK